MNIQVPSRSSSFLVVNTHVPHERAAPCREFPRVTRYSQVSLGSHTDLTAKYTGMPAQYSCAVQSHMNYFENKHVDVDSIRAISNFIDE